MDIVERDQWRIRSEVFVADVAGGHGWFRRVVFSRARRCLDLVVAVDRGLEKEVVEFGMS